MANLVKFLSGTKAAYNALGTSADVSTLYFIDDTHELYKGTMPIGNNHISGTAGNIVAVGADGQGLSASPYNVVTVIPDGADESKIVPTVGAVRDLISSGNSYLSAVTITTTPEGYITVGQTGDEHSSAFTLTINTAEVSAVAATGKLADAKDVHDYIDTVSGNLDVTFESASTPTTTAYLKTYVIKKGTNEIGRIDIPKDFLVKSATIKTCETKDVPVEGLVPGEKYLDLTINVLSGASEESHIYIPVKDLGVEYGAGEHIEITTSGSNATINVTGITTDGTGITEDSSGLTEGKAVYEFVKSEIITDVAFAGNNYIEVDAELDGQYLTLSAMPIVASASGEIATATSETHKLASDNAVKEYVDAKTQAHNAYTTITVTGESGSYTQNASTSASSATIEFVGTSNIAETGVTGNFIDVNVNSDNKVETVITVATSSATVEGTTYTTDNDTLISAKAVQELMTWGEIPEPTE